ncbi:MAG TPA: ArsA-related P-loop ATPase [Solirubrobacteraceae bacterium]
MTGKGGVGKSTVAAALGLVAAARGKRTVVAEVARREDVQRAVGAGVDTVSVDPQAAMEMYLEDQLAAPFAEVLKQSRIFGYLAAATPGMRELLTVGRLWELAQDERRVKGEEPYDLVVVDAPATGHGLALLDAPRTFAGVAAAGPVARQARIIHGTLTDRTLTGIVAVATPEEMPVNEVDFLREELGNRLDLVVANAVRPDRFTAADARSLARVGAAAARSGAAPASGTAAGSGAAPASGTAAGSGAAPASGAAPGRGAARAALLAHGRARAQREQLERLRPDVVLPFAAGDDGGADLDAVASALGEAL